MKWTKIVGALGLLVGSCCLAPTQAKAAAQSPSDPASAFSIVLNGPASPVPLNWPVRVTWTVTNTSDGDVHWAFPKSTSKDAGYLLFSYLLEKDGHEVEATFFNRKLTGRVRPSDPPLSSSDLKRDTILLPHSPGKMFDMAIDLKRLYEITEPGTYSFQVSRYDDVSRTLVKSNPVKITVTEPSQAPPPQVATPLPVAGTSFTLAIVVPQNNVSYYPAVAPKTYSVKSGSEIRVEVWVTNTSDHKIDYDPGITNLVFDVKNAQGEPAPLTVDGQNLRKVYGVGHAQLFPVPQGETMPAGAAKLHRIYDLNKPGVYTIQVSRVDEESRAIVKSNIITLTVVP